jgi:hypothetical protein
MYWQLSHQQVQQHEFGGQRQRQPQQLKPQRQPARFIKPRMQIDLQPVYDRVAPWIAAAFWVGLTGLIAWCAILQIRS